MRRTGWLAQELSVPDPHDVFGGAVARPRAVQEPAAPSREERQLYWPVRLAESLAILGTGLASSFLYHRLVLRTHWAWDMSLALALAITVLFAVGAHAARDGRAAETGRMTRELGVWTGCFLFFIVAAFAFQAGQQFSRGTVFLLYVTGLPAAFVARRAMTGFLTRSGWVSRRAREDVIVVANCFAHIETARGVLASPVHASILIDTDCPSEQWPQRLAVGLQAVTQHACTARRAVIYLFCEGIEAYRLSAIVARLRLLPYAVRVVPDAQAQALLRWPVLRIGGLYAAEPQREPLNAFQRFLKRALDLTLSSAAVLVLAPLLLAIAVAVRLETPGPALFRQTRIGLRGESFRIFKFRTMTVAQDEESVVQASRGDKRVTRIGQFLRRTSLDELPQFLNVLKGEMSLVGPRPHAAAHDRLYMSLIEHYHIRQHVKPGLTGWAQVHGLRGETGTVGLMRSRIEHDIVYAVNAGLLLDLEILLRTIPCLLGHRNAY